MKSFASKRSPLVSPVVVGKPQHAVGVRRRPAFGWAPWLAVALTACTPSPEALLVGHWREADWRYETLAAFELSSLAPPSEATSAPALSRHEAEQWEFRRDGTLIVSRPGREPQRARWQLTGRGHLLRLRGAASSSDEIYEIEELNRDRLVLHYEIGMEVRGVARLRFENLARPAAAELAVR